MLITILPVQTQAASKVKLNKTKTTIYVGSNTTLKLSGTSKKITWSTSKKSVATVNSKGKVTAKKAGKATITAKVSGKKYNCKITVKNPYLSATSINLTVKQKYTLKLTGTTATKYSSSNKSIATVTSRGKITARKAGKTTITVRGKNGKKYKCKVTVKAKRTVCNSHDWDSGVVTKAATCKETGIKTYTCTKCGKTKTEDISRVPHSYGWVTTKEPTLDAEGSREYRCSKCGDVDVTESIPKLTLETDWVYSGDTRTKTMADGTSFTETKYSTSSGVVWGFYDDAAASQMFTEIQNMQRQAYGEANVAVWDESQIGDAKLMAAKYAACGTSSKLFHSSSGGFPNVSDNRKYITFTDSYGLGLAISCFVIDSRGGWEQFTYGDDWRTYFATYYSSAF